jgi:hypothetical protein
VSGARVEDSSRSDTSGYSILSLQTEDFSSVVALTLT